MDAIKTYNDYINVLQKRAILTGKAKEEAERCLLDFKETQPNLYEEYRNEKIMRRTARTMGLDLPSSMHFSVSSEEMSVEEQVVDKVAFLLRLIDENKKYGIPIDQDCVEEVKKLYEDKEVRKILRDSGNRTLLYLLEHRKKTFSKRIDTRLMAEISYEDTKRVFGLQWVTLYEFVRESPSVEIDGLEVGSERNYGGISNGLRTGVPNEEIALVELVRNKLKEIDDNEGSHKKEKEEALNEILAKKSNSRKATKKYDYYLLLLLEAKRNSLKSSKHKDCYKRLLYTSKKDWINLTRQYLESMSVVRRTDNPNAIFTIFSNDDIDSIMSRINEDTIYRRLDNNGMINREKLFELAMNIKQKK